jgi:hypothetical protein
MDPGGRATRQKKMARPCRRDRTPARIGKRKNGSAHGRGMRRATGAVAK